MCCYEVADAFLERVGVFFRAFLVGFWSGFSAVVMILFWRLHCCEPIFVICVNFRVAELVVYRFNQALRFFATPPRDFQAIFMSSLDFVKAELVNSMDIRSSCM